VGFGIWDLRETYVTLGQLGIGLREAGLDRIAEQCLVAPSVHPHVVGKLLIPRFDILHVDLDGALRTVGYLLLPRTNRCTATHDHPCQTTVQIFARKRASASHSWGQDASATIYGRVAREALYLQGQYYAGA